MFASGDGQRLRRLGRRRYGGHGEGETGCIQDRKAEAEMQGVRRIEMRGRADRELAKIPDRMEHELLAVAT